MSFTNSAGDAAKPLIFWYLTNPYAIGGTVAIAYGLRNPHTRGWTIRMLTAYGKNSAHYAYHMFKDSALITWSETVGAAGAKRRAASAASRRALAKQTTKKLGAKGMARAVLSRAVPFVGWGILAYDIGDWLIGDDPSFIGDIIEVVQ